MSENQETPKYGIADAVDGNEEAREGLMDPQTDIDPTTVADEDSEEDRLPSN